MDWRAFLILSKTRDYERMQFDRRREDYKKTKERILKYSLQNQVKYHTKIGNPSKLCYFLVNNGQFSQRFSVYSPIRETSEFQIFKSSYDLIFRIF